jgi:hypothetical protein
MRPSRMGPFLAHTHTVTRSRAPLVRTGCRDHPDKDDASPPRHPAGGAAPPPSQQLEKLLSAARVGTVCTATSCLTGGTSSRSADCTAVHGRPGVTLPGTRSYAARSEGLEPPTF